MRFFYIVLVSSIALSSFVWANTEKENKTSTTLTVEVVNKTENGTPVENDEVILQIFQHQQLYSTLEGNTSEDGKAVFENIPTGAQFIALPRAKHKEMMFTGQTVKLDPTQDKLVAQVEVFDVSTDKSKLSVQIHHIIIKASTETKTLEITEFMQLVNSSDKAISSKERDKQDNAIVLNIFLPKGFSNLQWSSYFEKNAVVVTDNGFYDVMAVPPGSYQATFSYTLDIKTSTMDIIKKISLPTDKLLVFSQGGVQLQGQVDIDKQTMNMNGVPMEYLKFDNIAPSGEIAFQVTGLTVDKHNWITWIILTSVFVLMIIFAVVRSGTGK